MLVVASTGDHVWGSEWRRVSENSAKIIFKLPEIGGAQIRFENRYVSGVGYQERGWWKYPGSRLPQAKVWYQELPARTVFMSDQIGSLQAFISQSFTRDGGPVAFDGSGSPADKQYGKWAVQSFRADGGQAACVGFRRFFGGELYDVIRGGSGENLGSKVIYGWYCTKSDTQVRAKRITQCLGAKPFDQPDCPPPYTETVSTPSTASEAPDQNALRKLTRSVPIAARWEGYRELMSGVLEYSDAGRSGNISFAPSADKTTCSGTWHHTSGRYGTRDKVKGTWAIACTNGRAAAGNYVSDQVSQGTGAGKDSRGKSVTFAFGK